MKYELTLTLRPIMYSLTPDQQFTATSGVIKAVLERFFQGAKYTAVAELTEENNVHYHCLVELTNHMDRNDLLNSFRWKGVNNIFGRKTCSQVVYEESYLRYMVKSTLKTSDIIKANPVICDYYKALSHKYNILGYFEDEPDYKVTA